MNYQLRDYQAHTIEALFNWFYQNHAGNPIVSACVGSGKSIMIAELCRRVITQWPNQRILMAVASRELVVQNYEKLHAIFPEGDMGLYSASVGRKNPHAQIVFATIGSIYNKAMHTGAFNICIVDECHNVSRSETGMYRQMIADYTRINPNFRTIGFTGTPFRGNGVLLTEGDEALFTHIADSVSIGDMLQRSFLAPLVLSETKTKTDITGVTINKATGDYNVSELAKAVDRDEITKSVVSEIIHAGQNRKSWLIFGVDVQHCQHIHDELKARGLAGAVVTGKTPKAERDRILIHYKSGKLRYVVNCMVLTVGFDAPGTDLIALVRNTRSPVLYVQIAGRGLRTAPGKQNCLWLDFTDTTATLGPIDQITGRQEPKKKDKAEAALKKCPVCEAKLPPLTKVCLCGFQFEFDQNSTVNHVASDAPILAGVSNNLIKVDRWNCKFHSKYESPKSLRLIRSLRVTYWPHINGNIPGKSFSEWICFEHQGYARRKSENWWLQCGGSLPFPDFVHEAIDRFKELKKPDYINIKQNGKFFEVVNHVYINDAETEGVANSGYAKSFRDTQSLASNHQLPGLP